MLTMSLLKRAEAGHHRGDHTGMERDVLRALESLPSTEQGILRASMWLSVAEMYADLDREAARIMATQSYRIAAQPGHRFQRQLDRASGLLRILENDTHL